MKLPELQSLLYRQDGDTIFTVEYDVAVHDALDRGPVLVEIRRDDQECEEDSGGVIGVGINKCADSGHVYVESVKQASLADRSVLGHV